MKMGPSEAPLSEKREDGNRKTERKCMIRQTLTALGPIISTVAAGMTSGFSAVLIPQLKSSNLTDGNHTSVNIPDYLNMNRLTVTGTNEESWVASSAALSMIAGCWVAGMLMERFGRKGAYVITSPVFVSGWVLVALAPSMTWLIIGRFISGLCSGLNGPLSPVFIAETSEPALRGIFLAGISLAIAAGVLLSHVFGTWLHWRVAALLCGLFPAVCLILCLIAPESPTWLVKRKKSAKARKVWVSLRGEYCEQEFEALQSKGAKPGALIEDEKDLEKSLEVKPSLDEIGGNSTAPAGWRTIIVSRTFIIPFLILNVFFFVSQFSGANAVVFYSVDMFKNVAGGESAYVATLLLDLIRVIFSGIACWLTRNCRRRLLTMVSGIGTVISLIFLSGSLFTGIGEPWLPICFLFSYMCFISIGLVPLPWLLCGELFATPVRGLGSGLSSSLAFTFFFIVVKTAPGMMENPGPPWTFACYGIIVFAGTIFLYFFLPETKDKTLIEIEERYAGTKSESIKMSKISAHENGQS